MFQSIPHEFGRALTILLMFAMATIASGQRQMEKLGRGVVAVRTGASSAYVGWRLLGTDAGNVGFNVLRSANGGSPAQLNGALLTGSCNFTDNSINFAVSNAYFIQPVVDGVTQAWSAPFGLAANPPTQQYLNIPLQQPAGGTTADGVPYTYTANDCSAADLDGDGEYEIVLKWDPTNSKDNSQSGFTGNVFLDAYKLNGVLLWRIDLGQNIRAGAHYTQFMVYDLDGDGRAELACKTAPGTRDGMGNYVDGNAAFTVYTNSSGYILSGPEYFTIFDGLTGAKLWNTNYVVPRGTVSNWGDGYGNRVDRFLAGVAYLDGVRPSVVMCRGYYTRTTLCAWDWRDGVLTQRWLFDTGNSGGPWSGYKGQGAHSLTIGDVDGDGKDEITYGACAIDDNGTGLYTTGLGHGDALHMSDMNPDRPGLEVWMAHEDPGSFGPNGLDFRDARTGQVIFGVDGEGSDVGRGVAIDIDPNWRGYEMWGSRGGLMSATGAQISSSRPGQMNFACWWDADTIREILDGTTVTKWNPATSSSSALLSPSGVASVNGTKANPNLSVDLFGDWREEIIWRTSDNLNLRIYTTTAVATNRLVTLMHDPQYRLAIAWQNVAYNQPPHPGYYLGPGMFTPPVPPISTADLVWRGGGANTWDAGVTSNWRTNGVWVGTTPAVPFTAGRSVLFDISGSNHSAINLTGTLTPAAVTVHAPKDYTLAGSGSLSGTMQLTKAGPGRLTLNNTNTHTGGTVVSGGALFVNGALSGSPVTIERRGTPEGPSQFGGNGRLGNGLTMQAGCVLAVGAGTNLPGSLTVTNTLALQGVLSRFDLSNDPGGGNDSVQVYGNLSLSGTNIVEVTQLDGSLGAGVYPLFKYTGTLSGGLANLVLSGSFAGVVALTNPPGMIAVISAPPVPLAWRGDGSSNVWDVATTANWFDGSGLVGYPDGASVTFDNSGSNSPSVNLVAVVQPAAITVTGSKNYTVVGSGSLAGTMSLVKAGSGIFTMGTTNTYSGGTILSNGVLALSGSGAGGYTANSYVLGAGAVMFRGGTLRLYGYGMSDNVSSFGSFTNELVVAAGQVGTLMTGPRQALASRVTGAGTLNLSVEYVRGDVAGDWTGFTGNLNVNQTTGTPPSSPMDDFRVLAAGGFPLAKVSLGANVVMYSRAPANSIIPIGNLSANPGAVISANGGTGLGAQNAVTWRVGGLNAHATNSAIIQTATSLIKEGGGVWTLAGDNTYTGTTVVNGGTLLVNGNQAAATGSVTVTAGGRLGGTGIVGGHTTINGLLVPGVSIGTLTFSQNLTLNATGRAQFEISKNPAANDLVSVAGNLAAGGTLEVLNTSIELLAAGDNYQLLSAGSYSGAFAAYDLPALEAGLAWDASRLMVNGRLWVVSTRPPVINAVSATGGNFSLSGTGGTPNWNYSVLSTTNLAQPLAQWSVAAVGQFDASGNFLFTTPMDTATPRRFYVLRAQ